MSLRDQQGVDDIDPHVYDRRWRILGVLCMSLVLVVAGNASLNVALPVLARDLPATQTDLQWLVDVYALVFAGLLFPAGALGDRYGRKGALQTGLAIFALGAFGASTADSAPAVIGMRAVMGIGAAFVMPSTLSLVVASFPQAERNKAIAIWAGFAGTGASVGVIASGLLLEWFWWGSVFLINVPIALAALVMGLFVLPRSRDRRSRPLDPVGTALSVVGLVGVVYGIIEGPHLGWTAPEVLGAWAVGVTALVAFVAWERRTRYPMFDLAWLVHELFGSTAPGGRLLLVNSVSSEHGIMSRHLLLTYRDLVANAGFLRIADEVMVGTKDAVEFEILVDLFEKPSG
ncbi:MAG: MFS transporter [Actinobacteria bacterium]|nr:MFS transporter [Actinomycetota bacterium]